MRGIHDDKLRGLVSQAQERGWRVEIGGGTHVKFYTPEGKYVTSCTTTSTGSRTYLEVRSKLRRAGLEV